MTFEALLVHHAPGFVVISILNSMYQVAVFLLTTFNIFQIKDHGNALGHGWLASGRFAGFKSLQKQVNLQIMPK